MVVIDLLGNNTPVDVQQQGSKSVVRTMGNKIPTHLARRLNTNEFATPVASVDAYNGAKTAICPRAIYRVNVHPGSRNDPTQQQARAAVQYVQGIFR